MGSWSLNENEWHTVPLPDVPVGVPTGTIYDLKGKYGGDQGQ